MQELKLSDFSAVNRERSEAFFFPIDEWTPTDYGCALAGETGELCNKLKKLRRGENINLEEIAEEIADVVIYADLIAHRLGLDLTTCLIQKFNARSERLGAPHRLPFVVHAETDLQRLHNTIKQNR